MVIKGNNKKVKRPQLTAGFMLLEAVALVGLVVIIASVAAMLHGRIMMTYRETDNRLHGLLYAENVLASAVTGAPYTLIDRSFASRVQRTKGTLFLSTQKPYTVVTATITWQERGTQKKIELARLVADDRK